MRPFKFTIEIFGVKREITIQAKDLTEAKAKLDKGVLNCVKILKTEYTEPKTLEDIFNEFGAIIGDFLNPKK